MTGNNQYKIGSMEQSNTSKPKTLSELGITPKQSSTFQSIANIPEIQFEQVIAENKPAVVLPGGFRAGGALVPPDQGTVTGTWPGYFRLNMPGNSFNIIRE